MFRKTCGNIGGMGGPKKPGIQVITMEFSLPPSLILLPLSPSILPPSFLLSRLPSE
jgi:hypothetical protein